MSLAVSRFLASDALSLTSNFSGFISSTIMRPMEILLLHQEKKKKVFTYSLLIMLLLSNIKFLQQLRELHFLLDASDNDEGIQ